MDGGAGGGGKARVTSRIPEGGSAPPDPPGARHGQREETLSDVNPNRPGGGVALASNGWEETKVQQKPGQFDTTFFFRDNSTQTKKLQFKLE